MKLKICGLKQSENIREINELRPDFMGFIFYPKSKRFVEMKSIEEVFRNIDAQITKTAVFVNESVEYMQNILKNYGFNAAQLHGNEKPGTALELKKMGYLLIKAFSINDNFNFELPHQFEGVCDYFLFDTATKQYGGSGKKFNWDLLENYQGQTPFLLSGGISLNDVREIKMLQHPLMAGIDVNSGFEIEPGLKDIDLLKKFIKEIRG